MSDTQQDDRAPEPPLPPRREIGPEDEDRKSPDGPGSQITPEVEPSGS